MDEGDIMSAVVSTTGPISSLLLGIAIWLRGELREMRRVVEGNTERIAKLESTVEAERLRERYVHPVHVPHAVTPPGGAQ